MALRGWKLESAGLAKRAGLWVPILAPKPQAASCGTPEAALRCQLVDERHVRAKPEQMNGNDADPCGP